MKLNKLKSFTIAQKVWSLLALSERHNAIKLLILMVIGMGLEALSIGLVLPALGLLAQNNFSAENLSVQNTIRAFGNPSRQNLILGGLLFLVAVYIFKAIFLALLTWRQLRFAFDVQARLSQELFSVYLHQPYTFHLERNSAQLIRNVINEVSQFIFSGLIPAMLLLTELLVLFGLCCLLMSVEPLGALAVVIVFSLASWGFYRLTQGRIARWGEERQHHEGLRIQHLQQGLGGVKDLKLLGREIEFVNKYSLHNMQSARVGQLQTTLQQIPRLWLELLAVCGLAILVASMLAQERPLETLLPALGLFAAAAFRLMPSVNRILGSVQAMRYGLPGVSILCEEMSLPISRVADANNNLIMAFKDKLELHKVSYTYPGSPGVALKDISLEIKQGESIGFIGASGAGKSTLVDILLGLLTPSSGEVMLDGKTIQENLRGWQSQIGYVPQSIYLTDDSLRRNVAFGLSDDQIDNAAVDRALRAAQLTEFVQCQPDGLETIVGEHGIRLSGGQRQRIGIARALYHDPSVLVLDEATSSLDTDTEIDVMESVRALHGSKTIIIVAHRLSTIKQCDRVFKVADGRLLDIIFPEGATH